MQALAGKISSFGAFLSLAGIVSSALSLFNYELRILMWIDLWGTGVGWLIRIGLIVVGVGLFFLFKGKGEPAEAASE